MENIKPHEFFAWRVAEAYVLHLMSINRRPVYRYSSGDIEVDRHFLMPLLDGYLADRKSENWRRRFYVSMLQKANEPDSRSVFMGGRPPLLNKRGIKYMNALVHEFGDMLEDIGGRDEAGRMTMPTDDDFPVIGI
ncbi:hypothetical protein DT73_00400 [Mangrovibacter sp. MFB070]|uniref:hypothetical protein n=1 Tax=Mangrovibacter sp. MFB070 TaxID=1224318 RepID=UPI0004D460CC|nr:hypothetical protein [Mangrovibacter sp. MFB070]KEA54658.1 hypothetical protein DT73_00400 [Mangrovibacter sp. MFB070]